MRHIIILTAALFLSPGLAVAQSDKAKPDKAQNEKCVELKGEEKAACMKALAGEAKTARTDEAKGKAKDKAKKAKNKAEKPGG